MSFLIYFRNNINYIQLSKMNTSVKKGLIIGGASLIFGLAALFWYLGMSNNNRLIAKIPKDAAIVLKADLKSLAD